MNGWHWKMSIRHDPRYVNIPYRSHRIIVIGLGRLGRDARFHRNQPCCYRMTLLHCCPSMERGPAAAFVLYEPD